MDVDWDFLKIYDFIPVRAGERYYDFPANMDEERTYKWEYKYNNLYIPMTQGINRISFAARDSERDQRNDPVRAFDFHLDQTNNKVQFEVWPTPAVNGNVYSDGEDPPARETVNPNDNPSGTNFIRVRAVKRLTKMTTRSSLSNLDGDLIILATASKEATRQKSTNAQALATEANAYLNKLKGRLKKTDPFLMGTDLDSRRTLTPRRETLNDIRYRFAFRDS
jgi:hypothetical protein